MELCKHVETTFVPSGAILFRPGLLDDSIYVVKNGRLKVYIMEPVRIINYITCIINYYGRELSYASSVCFIRLIFMAVYAHYGQYKCTLTQTISFIYDVCVCVC